MGIVANSNAMFDGEFPITRSLRFNATSSQYLTRTPSVVGNRKTWTWSSWVKHSAINASNVEYTLFSTYAGNSDSQYFIAYFYNGVLRLGGFNTGWRHTTQLFRDPTAHSHVMVVLDTTSSIPADRVKLYINGVQVTSFTLSNNPTQNLDLAVNQTAQHAIGTDLYAGPLGYFDGYMTEVHFIDGQAQTPSSFGRTNPVTGQWVAKKYTGTYGTNGFYLDFKDGTSTTTLGYDKSGNNNHWTLTNFTRSAGVNDCWMKDVPAGNGSASAVQPSGNYATLNPLASYASTKANGNLNITGSSPGDFHISSISLPTTGKYYFEASSTSFNGTFTIVGWFGVCSANLTNFSGYLSRTTVGSGAWQQNDVTLQNINFGSINSIFGVAVDRDNNTVQIYLNGVLRTEQTPTLATGIDLFFVYGTYTSGTGWANFGQRSFAYTPPTGFKALCTSNLPVPIIEKGSRHFDITLYTGNGTNQNIVNSEGFSPDLFWTKARTGAARNHALFDRNRGPNQGLYSSLLDAEGNWLGNEFTSNGFKVDRTFSSETNENAIPYVAWQWKASGQTPIYNNRGTLASYVNANIRAGFSISTYTGNGYNSTVGHGLSTTPKLVIIKNRTSGANSWIVGHQNLTSWVFALNLNNTNAQVSAPTVFNSTNPTTSTFSVGTATEVNALNSNYVAYCFAEVEGYSKIGSYIGNGSADGTFVYTGFRPRFILFKRTDAASAWVMYDSIRDTYNPVGNYIQAQSSAIETSAVTVDFTSNGFKIRTAGDPNVNAGTYIYYAIAETPFQCSNAR